MPLITDEQVVLDLTGADRHEATRVLAQRLVASGRCTYLDTFLADVTERESKMATGLPGGIGIPHARSAAITEPSLGLLISNGFTYMLSGKYWISFFPGVALLVTIVAINLVGDQLRDVLNPRLQR